MIYKIWGTSLYSNLVLNKHVTPAIRRTILRDLKKRFDSNFSYNKSLFKLLYPPNRQIAISYV